MLCVCLGLCLGLSARAGEPNPSPDLTTQKDKIKLLVTQLGDADFDVRENASSQLKDLGEAARSALEAAQKGNDPEVAHAASMLLKNINRATVVVKVLGPDQKPLPEVDVILNISRMGNGRVIGVRRPVTVKTDANGIAMIGDNDPGMYYINIGVNALGMLPANLGKPNQKLGVGNNEFSITCQRGGSIKGSLLGADKAPLAKRRVVLCHAHFLRFKTMKNFAQLLSSQKGVETDEKGLFQFETLHPQEYFLAVVEGEKVLFTSKMLKVEGDQTLDAGELVTEVKPEAAESAETAKPESAEKAKTETAEKKAETSKLENPAPQPQQK
ncbi:MAG: hypothetical protein KIS92_11135 [Planctomycetota bacterium]|nr:hypothetical protein [Planctomycetota bacterium]